MEEIKKKERYIYKVYIRKENTHRGTYISRKHKYQRDVYTKKTYI